MNNTILWLSGFLLGCGVMGLYCYGQMLRQAEYWRDRIRAMQLSVGKMAGAARAVSGQQ
jgi:hypothetical protein